jgi:hypothetical protein
MKENPGLVRKNNDLAQTTWGELSATLLQGLEELTDKYGLSVALGDLQQIDGRWYVTHAGLLRTAQRRRCHGIRTSLQKDVSDPIACRWVFKATVYKTPSSRGFVGYGDADPTNVSALVRGGRDAHGRDPSGRPGPSEGLRNWTLFCRGIGIVLRSTKVHRRIAAFEWRQQLKRFKQRPPSTPGPALPFNPEVRA